MCSFYFCFSLIFSLDFKSICFFSYIRPILYKVAQWNCINCCWALALLHYTSSPNSTESLFNIKLKILRHFFEKHLFVKVEPKSILGFSNEKKVTMWFIASVVYIFFFSHFFFFYIVCSALHNVFILLLATSLSGNDFCLSMHPVRSLFIFLLVISWLMGNAIHSLIAKLIWGSSSLSK